MHYYNKHCIVFHLIFRAVKQKDSKLQGAKRGQQADRTKNAQMLEEARRRESEAAKEAAKAQVHLHITHTLFRYTG